MKIVIVGGTGLIGKEVTSQLSKKHEVITAGYSTGDLRVDISDTKSILEMYKTLKTFDALIATTGKVLFEEFSQMTPEKYHVGLENKLMGQVNLVLIGQDFIRDKGSFTLTSGILKQEPIAKGSSAAMINGALEGFVKSASRELFNQSIRLNCVSPTVIKEAMDKYADFFPGFFPVSLERVALAYIRSVEGIETGKVFAVY